MKKLGLIAGAIALALVSSPASAQTSRGVQFYSGTIDYLLVDDINDVYSPGVMVVGGQIVNIPANMVIGLPANFLTLQMIFDQAPPASKALGESGLAAADISSGGVGGVAAIICNITPSGNIIAGDIFIEKGQETITGNVTLINYRDGYLRVNGIPGDNTTGVMVRINDPAGRFTIQRGAGCERGNGVNCSADPRFGVDSDNYTITFTTSYPACIPSSTPAYRRTGFDSATDDPMAKADKFGEGDIFCPCTNREIEPVPDSTVFAPILLGDMLQADGNFETVNGQRFLSAHTITVFDALQTRPDPDQPDYIIFDEAEWDVPGFLNLRHKSLFIGFSTLFDSQLDMFALHVDPVTNETHEFPFGSTVGNPDTINHGVGATAGGVFKIGYDLDFISGFDDSPCANLFNAGLGLIACPGGGTFAENMDVMTPISREIIGRSRHKATLLPGIITRDIRGEEATNGEYLTPVGVGFPEMGEIDLDGFTTPVVFSGVPWLMDRRLSPAGCENGCEGTKQPLAPFPASGLHPTNQVLMPPGTEIMSVQYYPFGPGDDFSALLPVPIPGPMPIFPTPIVP